MTKKSPKINLNKEDEIVVGIQHEYSLLADNSNDKFWYHLKLHIYIYRVKKAYWKTFNSICQVLTNS